MPVKQTLLQDTNDAVIHSAKRCLGRFARSQTNHFSVRFSEILVVSGDWGTSRCRLVWRLKGTRRSRIYFHLHVINEDGLMWPTPQASDFVSTVQENNYSLRHLEHQSGWTKDMLPTPITEESVSKSTQLSPGFVLEMMGFPLDWTLKPHEV